MAKRRRLHDKGFDGCTAALRDARLMVDYCTIVFSLGKRNKVELRMWAGNRRKKKRNEREQQGCAASDRLGGRMEPMG